MAFDTLVRSFLALLILACGPAAQAQLFRAYLASWPRFEPLHAPRTMPAPARGVGCRR